MTKEETIALLERRRVVLRIMRTISIVSVLYLVQASSSIRFRCSARLLHSAGRKPSLLRAPRPACRVTAHSRPLRRGRRPRGSSGSARPPSTSTAPPMGPPPPPPPPPRPRRGRRGASTRRAVRDAAPRGRAPSLPGGLRGEKTSGRGRGGGAQLDGGTKHGAHMAGARGTGQCGGRGGGEGVRPR